MELDLSTIPGYDPDREPYVQDTSSMTPTPNSEISKNMSLMYEDNYTHFKEMGISEEVVNLMKIGFNGRYLVYPYYLADQKCYGTHCLLHGKQEDFWQGDEKFTSEGPRIFNEQEISRCEEGALFITDSEDQLLVITELGYPGIAVPSAADIELINPKQLTFVNHIFIVVTNSPEARLFAHSLATKLGFKVRIIRWPSTENRDYNLCQLARDNANDYGEILPLLIKSSKVFSPFPAPAKEFDNFIEILDKSIGNEYKGFQTGFKKMDLAHNGISGINIMGGQPKAGKSCYFMQVSTEIARSKNPVIYYDFENGSQKIYTRTLSRLSRLSEKDIMRDDLDEESMERLKKAKLEIKDILEYFKVVTDRKLTPDMMRKHIDFIQHETRKENVLIVIDSLHKLPFKDVSERRTGIDLWLRQLESIRDGYGVSFLVISELSRGEDGYKGKPNMGLFKASGDIEYSADSAMIFVPDWDPVDPVSIEDRTSTLWMVASRENTPGKIATYSLQYPFWEFKEL